jgi:hypothetical protein
MPTLVGRPPIGPRVQTRLDPETHRLLILLQRKKKLRDGASATRLVIQAGIDALRSRGEL